jgi:D-lactate dehydrogenase (cytochrome)
MALSQAPLHHVFNDDSSLANFLSGCSRQAVVGGKPGRIPPAYEGEACFVEPADMRAVLDYPVADQVIWVEAGMTIRELDQLLEQNRQWWPVAAPADATIFDTINNSDGGCLAHGFAGPRELVIGARVVMAAGQIIKCGGSVVKNVTGYDLLRLFIGSHGWLGLVTAACLRLYARPEVSLTMFAGCRQIPDAFALASQLAGSGLPLTCLEVVAPTLLATLVPEQVGLFEPVASRSAAVVLVRAQGAALVLPEVVDALRSMLPEPAELTGSEEALLWERLSGTEDTLQPGVEICLSAELMGAVLERVKEDAGMLWQARPSRGRLRLSSHLAADAILEMLRSLAIKPREIIVAIADEHFNRRVCRLPRQDEAGQFIKQKLKDELDPRHILNPFVLL